MKDMRTLSVTEVMARTGFSRDRIYRLVKRGAVQVVRVGRRGHMRIVEASLERWFDAHLSEPAPEIRSVPRELDPDALLPPLKHAPRFS